MVKFAEKINVRKFSRERPLKSLFTQARRRRRLRQRCLKVLFPVISELLWFMITSLSDWFKVPAPFFQPIRSETKTNRGSRVHMHFPALCVGYE